MSFDETRSARSAKTSTLVELRGRVRGLVDGGDEEALRRFASSLQEDGRAGARELRGRCERYLRAMCVERERMHALFVLRGKLLEGGIDRVAGVDEVGVGPLAGPVVAAAVILPGRVDLPGLNDSKRLRRGARERLDRSIREQALAVAVGEVTPEEIDRLNIYHAALEAMRRAVSLLSPPPDHLLVDARRIPGVSTPQTAIIHGDAVDGSIAAASIVAKVHRDAIMRRLDLRFPGYGFARHMGYPTAFHVDALSRMGASPVHRQSFGPVAAVSEYAPGS